MPQSPRPINSGHATPPPLRGRAGTRSNGLMSATTVNPEEVAKFSAMAEEWWDPAGKFKPIHALQPVRLAYIREQVLSRFGREGNGMRPFEGLGLLDVGCGGGLLSEPMARLGARVTGIDAAEENLSIASAHAETSGLEIAYRATPVEALAESGETFDVVLAMEVVEHVEDVALFLESCARCVAPGGLIVLSTLNRTARAWALAVVGAEYVLGWLPRGTHDWKKFLTPEEIETMLRRSGLDPLGRAGMTYHPLAGEWRRSTDLGVNYMLAAGKPAG